MPQAVQPSPASVPPPWHSWDKQADGLSEEFVSEVSETIKHGQSAIFAMVETRDPDAMAAYFRGTGGNIIRTTLSPYEQERAQDSHRQPIEPSATVPGYSCWPHERPGGS